MTTNSASSVVERFVDQPLLGRWLASLSEAAGSAGAMELGLVGEGEGRPPVLAEAADYQVIFDGVLHNREELRRRYAEPERAETNDADLILMGYRRRGEEILREVKGIFALLILDRSRRTFLGVRDPMGVYPLFYAEAGAELLFSTSAESILNHPGVSREVNRAALADNICHRWNDPEETFWAGIKRVPPGHWLRGRAGARQVSRYWDPAPAGTAIKWVREDEIEQFEELLVQAVNRYLGLGPTGIYLSGGLDSVSVAAVAQEQCVGRGLPVPVALSLVFPDIDCNEEAMQRGVAEKLGLPQIIAGLDEAVGEQGLFQASLIASRRLPAPLLNVYHPAYRFLGQAGRQRGCRILLTGGGGDEWLGAGPLYAADMLRELNFAGLYRLWNNLRLSFPISPLRLLRNIIWDYSLRPWLGVTARRSLPTPMLRAYQRRRTRQWTLPWIAPEPALQREMAERAERAEQSQTWTEWDSIYVREMRRALDHPLFCWELEEAFENGRRAGQAILQPFLDADLVDWLYRIPPELLNRGGRSKGILREMAARKFPNLGFERQKKVIATNFFLKTCLLEEAAAWESVGGTPALADLGIVDSKSLAATVSDILTNKQERRAYRIWDVLNSEVWLQSHA